MSKVNGFFLGLAVNHSIDLPWWQTSQQVNTSENTTIILKIRKWFRTDGSHFKKTILFSWSCLLDMSDFSWAALRVTEASAVQRFSSVKSLDGETSPDFPPTPGDYKITELSFYIQNERSLKQLDGPTYRASVYLPVRSISPLRAMKVSLPQQRKIPAEKWGRPVRC